MNAPLDADAQTGEKTGERAGETLARTRALLEGLDESLAASGRTRSLAPGRARATPLITLFDRLAPKAHPVAFGRALHRLAAAQLEAFPDNLFWDLDALAAALARRADPGAMAATSATVAALQDLFGQATPIHFRYVHDFLYGFDWARWVAREPEARQHVGPFDDDFLSYTWRRGHELLLLIANDDEKYPKLPDGRPRNPFVFSREPEDEARLLEDLAARDAIPVRAWETDPPLVWDRPYRAIREERAQALAVA